MKKYEDLFVEVSTLLTSDVVSTSSFDGDDHILSKDEPKH